MPEEKANYQSRQCPEYRDSPGEFHFNLPLDANTINHL
ncbi:hypothetical protein NSP_20720 [Nodularia spumigena CCY9414]|nr:hypothetical protein NSP_20720 [Nodularia spumigena CCY9414]